MYKLYINFLYPLKSHFISNRLLFQTDGNVQGISGDITSPVLIVLNFILFCFILYLNKIFKTIISWGASIGEEIQRQTVEVLEF